jgi:hypothetical protein
MTDPTPTPNEELATALAEALVDEGLVPAARRGELRQGLAAGTLRERDWLELVAAPEAAVEPSGDGWN